MGSAADILVRYVAPRSEQCAMGNSWPLSLSHWSLKLCPFAYAVLCGELLTRDVSGHCVAFSSLCIGSSRGHCLFDQAWSLWNADQQVYSLA